MERLYDLAGAVAVFGLVVVDFKTVTHAEERSPAWPASMVGLLDGRAECVAGVVLAHYWRKRFRRGPVEAASRVLTDSST